VRYHCWTLAGGMAVRVREQATAAQRRADEAAALYDLSQAISAQLDFNEIAPMFVTTATRLLGSPGCRLLLCSPSGELRLCAESGIWPRDVDVATASLRSGGQHLGELQIVSQPQQIALVDEQQRLLETLAGQAALALERSRLSQAAAQAEALAASDRLKSTLLSAISHDVRTPLASISAAAEELLSEDVAWPPAAIHDFAQVIDTQAQRLNHLMTNLLDLTRIEAGVLRPQRGWYNVAEIIYSVLDRLGSDLADRQLELIIADDLPLLPVDYVQLEQVLWNIFQNALKYTPPGSPITIAVTVREQQMLIQIGDRGPGIAPDERMRVFEKFYRLPQANGEKVAGTGIGLAICKGLIDAHGGEIAILGREGGGTLVEMCLPLQYDEQAVLAGA
jgi:two-component system sensor histidine kinase KdpD